MWLKVLDEFCMMGSQARPPSAGGNRRRGIPAAAAAAAERTASRQVTVDITKTSLTSRKINAAISIAAPVEVRQRAGSRAEGGNSQLLLLSNTALQ
jgi:hypothetical protein